jgi:hypothetical protein
MKERFKIFNFQAPRLEIIQKCNLIIEDYQSQGYDMTLRQLYYQFIGRDWFPSTWIDEEYNKRHNLAPNTKNTEKNYDRLGQIVNDGRLAGLIDWFAIVDRTRGVIRNQYWNDPADIVEATSHSFLINKWDTQDVRVEVWIEKDALVGVFRPVARRLDLPLFSCRGYNSSSDMYGAGRRLRRYLDEGKRVYILHFGDHDCSGLDMTRDIRERLDMFTRRGNMLVDRLALNMMQIDEYNPPPNPAKETDSRAKKYIEIFGNDCYELDALSPTLLNELVENQVKTLINAESWAIKVKEEEEQKLILREMSKNFPLFEKFIKNRLGKQNHA